MSDLQHSGMERIKKSLSIVHVGPYLVALVCIPQFIDYPFRVSVIFWFLYFGLFQVKVQLVSK
jgi:hypothetical protein